MQPNASIAPMAQVVVTWPLPGGALESLAGHEVEVLDPRDPVTPERLRAAVADADGLLCMLTDSISRSLLQAGPRLRVVGVCAVGYDNVDVAAATELGIQVCNTPNVLTEATADLAWALLLAAARRLGEADALVRSGRFQGWRLDMLLGQPVYGRTLGIVGLGRIGSAVARRARGFDMRVIYAGRRRASEQREAELGARFVDKSELLRDSDFISVHLPLSAETRHYLDRAALSAMKPGAVIVNTSRGPVIDEAALAEAIASGHLFAAGLDVFEREPAVEPRLLELERAALAPHIGSATSETRAAMAAAVAADVGRVLRGEAPQNPVNRK
jgi:glyoxylate reductase